MKIIPFILLCALPSLAQQTNCLIPGTVSWWRAEGNANDSAGTNSGIWLNGEAYAPGKVGQAFNFNGTNGSIDVLDAPSLRFTNAITIEAWIYPRSVGGGVFRSILHKWEVSISGVTPLL